MSGCNIACIQTASTDSAGNRIMISTVGNLKYPTPHTVHKQCESCQKEMAAQLEAEVAALTIGSAALAKKYLETKKKFNL